MSDQRFNTGNPIGSNSPLDRSDNTRNLDLAVNSDELSWSDRLGQPRLTFAGMQSQFSLAQELRNSRFQIDQAERASEFDTDQVERENDFDAAQGDREQRFNTFIASSGYQFVGDYAPGIEITEYNQLVRDENGEFWRVSGQVDLPYVTTGAGIPEGDALVPAGDAVLRQDLASPDGHRLVANQLSANAYGSPAKAVNVQTAVDAPTVIDYFDGYFWGYRSGNLERSADGETWEIYATGLGFNFARLIPTSDGEVVGIGTDGVTVRKSIGFNGSSNPAWKTVLTNPSTAIQAPFLRWGFDGKGSKFIVTHYGGNVSDWVNSRYVWISTDAGETWNIVYDTDAEYPSLSSESHLHAACYDPWDDRFYFTEGHGTPNGMYYSDDDGVNWTKIQNIGLSPAPTVLVPTDFGIVIGTDSEPNGVAFLPRSHNPDDAEVQMLATVSSYGGRGGVIGFADRGMRDPETGIVYVAFNSQFTTNPTTIFAVGSGGAMPILESVCGSGGSTINRYSNVVAAKGKLLATHNVDGRVVADLPPYTQQTKPFDTGNLMPEVARTGQQALAVGRNAEANGLNSLSIGAVINNQDSVGIGFRGVTVSGSNAVVVGNTAKAGANGVTVGFGAESAANSTSVGYMSKTNQESVAYGSGAEAMSVWTTAIGRSAKALSNGAYSTAIGALASAESASCTSIGYKSKTVGAESTAVGRGASATAGWSTAIGATSVALNGSVSVGRGATTVNQGVAVGNGAVAGSVSDVVIGAAATSLNGLSNQTVVGGSASSEAAGSTALGANAQAQAGHDNSVALGRNSVTQRAGSVCVGTRDIESTRTSGRLILRSPDGTPWAITVDNAGVISATAI